MRVYLVVAAIALASCGADLTSPEGPGSDEVGVLVGAGDIGVCGSAGALATGRLLDNLPGIIVVPGDIAYPDGTAEQFQQCYEPAWGRHKNRTRPVPGNHEYGSPGAAPFFAYFGDNAGPPGLGYYRFRSGGWQVFALNSNADLGMRNMQAVWLRNEMVAQPSQCALAYFHHPRFSSGSHGTVPPPPVVPELWRDLHAAGVDVIIAAHEHFYERFAPQTPDGSPDEQFGIRQFIVGTGGAPLTQSVRRVANSEIVISAFGILRLTLEAQSYRWEFIAADAGAVLDSGSGRCHGKP